MTDDEDDLLRKHVRAALDVAINAEERRVNARLDALEAGRSARRAEMLQVVISALESLKGEVKGNEGGVCISVGATGGAVSLRSAASYRHLSISLAADKSEFEVEEYRSYAFGRLSAFRGKHRFPDAKSVLSLIIKAVGEHPGSYRAMEGLRRNESMPIRWSEPSKRELTFRSRRKRSGFTSKMARPGVVEAVRMPRRINFRTP
jgi:hypothetical protein